MKRAIELARKGAGFTNPNPLVGAVIVKDGRIIGEGYHKRYGEPHAERNAIMNATESTEGADMYVTLEPCSHFGKQPPCIYAVKEAGIKNVYIGSDDPNPLVSGKGIEYLRENGIIVETGILKNECDELNEIFFHFITKKRPFVIMKGAMSIDGRTAAYTGDSKWITNEKSREHAHLVRKRVAAIMVGVNTVIADDPMLNCRVENPKNPVRIICDSHFRIPLESKILKTAEKIPTIIAGVENKSKKIEKIRALGADVILTSGNRVNLNELMLELGKRGIDSVVAEGGGELHSSLLEAGLADKLMIYIAPKIIGGVNAKPVVGGKGVELVKDAYRFQDPKLTILDDDILVEYTKRKEG